MEIFNCLYKNDEKELQALLLNSSDLDVNLSNDAGLTPLHFAVLLGYVGCVSILMRDSRTDVNRCDNDMFSAPILEASASGNLEIVEMLLNAPDIHMNVVDILGCSAVFLACENGHVHIVERLCSESQVNINSRNLYGRTPLFTVCSVGDIAVIDHLLKRSDIDLNAADIYGRTAIHIAINNIVGNNVIDKLLGRQDLDINRADLRGNTPLHTAVKSEIQIYTVNKLLRDRRIDILSKNKKGFTATDLASELGYNSIITCFKRQITVRRWALIFCIAKLVILKRRMLESYYAYGGKGAIAAIYRCYNKK